MRSVTALLVDVPASHAALIARTLPEARAVPVNGEEALNAALQRRGWDAVLYGGDGPHAVPSQKALALVRLADPHLPFIAVSPLGHASAPHGVPSVSTSPSSPRCSRGSSSRRGCAAASAGRTGCCAAQQAIARPPRGGPGARGAVRAGAGDARRVARLGGRRRLAADGARLTCATAWHAATARASIAALTNATPRARRSPPGRACRAACGASGARSGARPPTRRCAPAW